MIRNGFKRRPEWGLFIAALLVRLAYMVYHLRTFGLDKSSDAANYIQFARLMREQGLAVLDIRYLEAHSGPGFPLLIYLDVITGGLGGMWITLGVGLLCNSLLAVVIFKLADWIFRHRKAAFACALWAIFYLHYIRYVPLINKENLVFLLFPLSIYAVMRWTRENRRIYLGVFVLSFVYLIHTDERYFFYLPILVGYVLWQHRGRWRPAVLVLLLIGTGMTPWLYRNYLAFGRPVLLTERTAAITDRVLGYNTPVNPYRKDRPKDCYSREHLAGYEAIRDSILQGENPEGAGYKHVDKMKNAMDNGEIPYTYSPAERLWSELSELLRPVKFSGTFVGWGYRYMPAWKSLSNWIYGIQYGLLLVLFPLGVFWARKKPEQRTAVVLLTALWGVHVLFHLFVGHALQRYRVPADFVLIIVGVGTLYTTLSEKYRDAAIGRY